MADNDKKQETIVTPSVNTPAKKQTVKTEPTPDNGLANLSAQIHPDVMPMLDSAAESLDCTRADVIRASIRYFIRSFSDGSGNWRFPDDVVDDMPYAAKPQYAARKLTR